MPIIKCHQCKKDVYKLPFHIRKHKHLFCNRKCQKEYQESNQDYQQRLFGENNPMWKGDKASKDAGHVRALKRFPEESPCIRCGNPKSQRHHVDGNTLNNDKNNIMRLCHQCHMIEDDRIGRLHSWHKNPENRKKFLRMMIVRNKNYAKKLHKMNRRLQKKIDEIR